MRRPRQTREQRTARFNTTREKWAATLEPKTRAIFETTLEAGDQLIEKGWALRKSAWALVRPQGTSS
jgi:hypothetical protein